jgi:pSer/pThr/pTyr-binding forkhead associated (FHA) protein/biotin carboxyl carrier protein
VPIPNSGEEPTKLFAGSMLDQAELRVVKGTYLGTTVGLSAGTVVIGRSSDCELSLKGAQGVSRRHCKVQYLGNRFVIIDLESRNGTIVNGQSVERKVLEKGDRIEVGDETIEFVVESLDDVRDVPLQGGAIEDQSTALVHQSTGQVGQPGQATGAFAQPRQEHTGGRAPPPPPTASLDDEAPLPETLPPQQARSWPAPGPALDAPRLPAQPELSSPYVHQPTAAAGNRAPVVLGVLVLLVVVGGGFLIYDLGFKKTGGEIVADVADAGTAAVAVAAVDAGVATVAVAAVDAGVATLAVDAATAAVAATTVDAGVVAVAAIDAGPAPVVDAGSAPPVVPADAPARVLRANVAGKATKVLVKVGDRVKVGDVLVVVAADSPNLMRKIDALRREEREFAESAKSDPSARGDLAAVRAELRKAESKLTPKNQTADSDGTVVEVLVVVGDTVRDGAPIFKLAP